MRKKSGVMQFVSLLAVTALFIAPIASCGGGSSDSGPSTVNYTSATQAAAGASSAKGAADLSGTMSAGAADLASSSNPSGYSAPGKGDATSAPDTTSLAGIDPRLKDLVDGMLSQMKSPAIKSAVANARSKTSMAPGTADTVTISGTCSGGTGTFSVTGTDTSVTGSYTEYTVDINYDSCKDVVSATDYSTLDGTIHVYDKKMADMSSTSRSATVNLTAKKYVSSALSKTDVLNGTFSGSDAATASGRSGTDFANGSFSDTVAATNQVGTFYFTNLTNNWITDTATNTRTDTGNGSFGFNVTSPSGSIGLNVGLSNLENRIQMNGDGSRDQWLNGSIVITWTPDLSIYGCVGGKITFTTPELFPLAFASAATCPSSGVLQVNNATIQYGTPITVTVGTDAKTFNSCAEMNQGLCG